MVFNFRCANSIDRPITRTIHTSSLFCALRDVLQRGGVRALATCAACLRVQQRWRRRQSTAKRRRRREHCDAVRALTRSHTHINARANCRAPTTISRQYYNHTFSLSALTFSIKARKSKVADCRRHFFVLAR